VSVVPTLRFEIGGIHITLLHIVILFLSFVLLAILYYIIQ